MTDEKKKAPNVLEHVEGKDRKTNPDQEEGKTMNTSLSPAANTGNLLSFDTAMKSSVNHGGSAIITNVGYSEYLGRHDISMTFTNSYGEVIYLAPAEARDLIASLQAQLVFMGEEYGEVAA